MLVSLSLQWTLVTAERLSWTLCDTSTNVANITRGVREGLKRIAAKKNDVELMKYLLHRERSSQIKTNNTNATGSA